MSTCPGNEDGLILRRGVADEGTDVSSSRPAYTPPSLVSGAGSLRKSLSLSRAKLFCTSFVKGEWKRKKPASL